MVHLPTPIEELSHPLLAKKEIRLFVKRDDLLHPEIMGNKWRKLKYNLEEAKKQGLKTIVTFGGAYSNHIAATAAAAKEFEFESVGIIRGEELTKDSNPTLKFASQKGMRLKFISRNDYRSLRDNPKQITNEFPSAYVLPEGGTNELAIKGCMEILTEKENDFDVVVAPIGTGGTFCGLINGSNKYQKILGVSSLKGTFIKEEINKLLGDIRGENFEINIDYHFGGYAKTTVELIDFINWFKEKFSIQLDPIYTGKSFFAVWDMIKSDKFEKNLKIMLLHTGGLQGIEGFNRKNQNIIQ